MAERMAQHVYRAECTQAALELLPDIPDIPDTVKAAHRTLIAAVDEKQVASDQASTACRIHEEETDQGWRSLWSKCVKWLAIAKVKATGNFRAGLDNISTDRGYSEWAARRRAQQILAALNECPEDFTAAGLTKTALQTEITTQLTRDTEQRRLETVAHDAKIALKEADHALDQENKRLYKILTATFDPDSREGQTVKTIPTETAPVSAPSQPAAGTGTEPPSGGSTQG